LRSIVRPEIKIITVEDPIEYHLLGVTQTQTDAEAGYTFASGLRSILRQDPNVILIGEIRDSETAEIAVNAALTGHMVLSTLHTNDSIGAIPRLIDLGAKSATLGPALTLVMAQRLVRVLCPDCKKENTFTPEQQEKIKTFIAGLPPRVDKSDYANCNKYYTSVGCEKCANIGYKGRISVFELLQVDEEIEKAIYAEANEIEIKEIAKRQGIVMMQEDGMLKILTGLTSFDEVEKKTGQINWFPRSG
jgi:type II secretory ATPase GspE/PulE/Tfp pilus assembly ATPase PilB-like protein